jgi:uncharacterized protein
MPVPGVVHRTITLPGASLRGYEWPVIEITGAVPGPGLAVMAGIHPNEVAAIEAVRRLAGSIDPTAVRGSIALLPIVNLPAVIPRTETICPIDGKNINFLFPGRADGSWSEAAAHGVLDWAKDADCLIDLHGGDLREDLAPFTVTQMTGDPAFDAWNEELSAAFGAPLLVRLEEPASRPPGRSVTARARAKALGVFAEGGRRGLLEEEWVEYHHQGVRRVAAMLGLLDDPIELNAVAAPIVLTRYLFLEAPVSGWCRSYARAGAEVRSGEILAEIFDSADQSIAVIAAPIDGHVLWRVTHPIVQAGDALVGLGAP